MWFVNVFYGEVSKFGYPMSDKSSFHRIHIETGFPIRAWVVETKIRHGKGKWILREILYKNLPRNLVDRPKSGFAIPLSDWLKGPLKNWSKDLINLELDSEDLFKDNIFAIKLLEEHQNGDTDNSAKLWPILMWKLWASNNLVNF